MSKYKCRFNLQWLDNDEFNGWIQADNNVYRAYCKLNKNSLDIGNIVIQTLKSYQQSCQYKSIQA